MGQLNRESSSDRVVARSAKSGEAAGSVRLGRYLRSLREGYGYTLRKVEEQAVALGEAIDNSQLSRFEKGKAVPSFEKLRALARVFNVPIQNFSDVLDLEQYQELKPTSTNYAELIASGADLFSQGEPGRAFVTYERAVEVAQEVTDDGKSAEMVAEARWRMACALKALGKLFMTEKELREILKQRQQLTPRTRVRTLLQLCYLYREFGDLYLATVLAKECLELAREIEDRRTLAGVLNTLGNISHDEGQINEAAEFYREALDVVDGLEGHHEMKAMVMTNLGGCLVSADQTEAGVSMLHAAHAGARKGGFRRVASLALTRLAEAQIRLGNHAEARERLSESDALSSKAEGCFYDILFLNAFHRWQMVRGERNTAERIAFGRLRHLRSTLQRRFPEVDEFDRHVERIRR